MPPGLVMAIGWMLWMAIKWVLIMPPYYMLKWAFVSMYYLIKYAILTPVFLVRLFN